MKKFLSLILSIIIAFSMVACGKPDPTPTRTYTSLPPSNLTPIPTNEWLQKYDAVISQYKNIINNKLDIIYLSAGFEYTNENLLRDETFVYYSLCDLNNNGIPELIIGGSKDNEKEISICDVFVYDNGIVRNLENKNESNHFYRTTVYLYENGTIYLDRYFPSASKNEYYKISQDEKIELIECVGREDTAPPEYTYSHYTGNDISKAEEDAVYITEKEYNNILNKYKDMKKNELHWGILGKIPTDNDLYPDPDPQLKNMYAEAISQYKAVVAANFYIGSDNFEDKIGNLVNLKLVTDAQDMKISYGKFDIVYSFYDFNNDGVPEMIIGALNNYYDPDSEYIEFHEKILNYDILTIRNNKVELLFKDIVSPFYEKRPIIFDTRFHFTLHENGIIAAKFTQDGFGNFEEFYKLSTNGTTPVYLEGIYNRGEHDDDGDIIDDYEYHDLEGNITKHADYFTVIKKYKKHFTAEGYAVIGKNDIKLTWHRLNKA